MASRTSTTQLNDAIPGDSAEQLAKDLQHQKSRLAIQEVVIEYVKSSDFEQHSTSIIKKHTDTVPFMKKVQAYADDQIDTRIFKSVQVVLGLVLGWIASIVIAVLIAKLTK